MVGDPQRAEDLEQEALVTTHAAGTRLRDPAHAAACCRGATTPPPPPGMRWGSAWTTPSPPDHPWLDEATLAVVRQTRSDRASPPLELLTCDVDDGGCEVVADLPSLQDLVGEPGTFAPPTGTSTPD